jgi:hypothetical protein
MTTYNSIGNRTGSLTFDGTNVLSNYVAETAWTPDLQFGGAKVGITYTGTREGYYTRIGNIIFYSGVFTLSSKGSSTGAVQIHGLPVAASQETRGVCTCGRMAYTGDGLTTLSVSTYLLVAIGSNTSTALAGMDNTHCTDNSQFRFSGFYFV